MPIARDDQMGSEIQYMYTIVDLCAEKILMKISSAKSFFYGQDLFI